MMINLKLLFFPIYKVLKLNKLKSLYVSLFGNPSRRMSFKEFYKLSATALVEGSVVFEY